MTDQIIVDTREQKPLWKGAAYIVRKLDVGDYSTVLLESHLMVERKSPGDLYGTILGGHERFRNELIRAIRAGKDIYVFVECDYDTFVNMKWGTQAYKLQGTPSMLKAIVATLEAEYDVEFVWCKNRNDMKVRIRDLFLLYGGRFI